MSRFLIACGGTGGHLSPGIALAEELAERGHDSVLLISHKQVDSRLVEKYPHFQFARQPAAPFSLHPARLPRFAVELIRGYRQADRLIRMTNPDLIFGFGGFTSGPVVLAARRRGLPVALHEANRIPGKAIRMLSTFAQRVYLPPGIALGAFPPERTQHCGFPVRREIRPVPREEARAVFGFDPRQKMILILGGSQGASALNEWAENQLSVLAADGVQVCCITGLGKGNEREFVFPSREGTEVRSRFLPFCDRMGTLLSAPDLAVSRAGAGTLAEFIRCRLPSVLIPFPFAADDHQAANAGYLHEQGGGFVVDEHDLGTLADRVRDLVFNNSMLESVRRKLAELDRVNPVAQIATDLDNLLDTRGPESGRVGSGREARILL